MEEAVTTLNATNHKEQEGKSNLHDTGNMQQCHRSSGRPRGVETSDVGYVARREAR